MLCPVVRGLWPLAHGLWPMGHGNDRHLFLAYEVQRRKQKVPSLSGNFTTDLMKEYVLRINTS
jgi:hypothetical protein